MGGHHCAAVMCNATTILYECPMSPSCHLSTDCGPLTHTHTACLPCATSVSADSDVLRAKRPTTAIKQVGSWVDVAAGPLARCWRCFTSRAVLRQCQQRLLPRTHTRQQCALLQAAQAADHTPAGFCQHAASGRLQNSSRHQCERQCEIECVSKVQPAGRRCVLRQVAA